MKKLWLLVVVCGLLAACSDVADVEIPVQTPNVSARVIPELCDPDAISCDGGGGTPPAPAPAPTGANLRVTATLTKVYARDTEDVTPTWPFKPTDEFYTVGSLLFAPESSGFGPSKAFMSPVFNARKGSTYTRSDKVMDVVVQPDTIVALEFNAFDEDIAKNSKEIDLALKAYSAGESIYKWRSEKDIKGLYALIKPALDLIASIAKMDEDDNLGGGKYDLGTLRQNQNQTFTKTFNVEQNDLEWWSEWDYDITYTIKVTPTNDPVTPISY